MEEHLLARATAAVAALDWTAGRWLSEEAIHRIWDRLHMAKWNQVDVIWRKRFAIACELLAECQAQSNDVEAAIATLDTGLLMAGPYGNDLHVKMSSYLPETTSPFSPPRKRIRVIAYETPYAATPLSKYIPRIPAPSLMTFLLSYMKTQTPVILTGAMEDWPALHRWPDMNYLKHVAGPRTVPVEIGANYLDNNWSQTLMTMHDFITQHVENAAKDSNYNGYLAQHALFEQVWKM
jgi:hypothetical protein